MGEVEASLFDDNSHKYGVPRAIRSTYDSKHTKWGSWLGHCDTRAYEYKRQKSSRIHPVCVSITLTARGKQKGAQLGLNTAVVWAGSSRSACQLCRLSRELQSLDRPEIFLDAHVLFPTAGSLFLTIHISFSHLQPCGASRTPQIRQLFDGSSRKQGDPVATLSRL